MYIICNPTGTITYRIYNLELDAISVGFYTIGSTFPVYALAMIIGVGLAVLVLCTSTNDTPPRYHPVSTLVFIT